MNTEEFKEAFKECLTEELMNSNFFTLLEVKEGKLRSILGIKDGESIEDHYKDKTPTAAGKAIGVKLLKSVPYEKAIKMLVFAHNMNKGSDVLKAAVNFVKTQKDKDKKD